MATETFFYPVAGFRGLTWKRVVFLDYEAEGGVGGLAYPGLGRGFSGVRGI